MRPPPVLIRRAVIDPLWLPAAAVLMVLLAVVAALAGLAWPLTRRRRLLRVTLFAMLYLLADTCLLAGAAIIWLRWPAAARRDDERWNGAHARLLSRALALLLASARPLFGFRVELEEPPDASQLPDRPLLVIARHGGPGDSFTLVELLLTRYGRQPRIVMKESLRWDPGLDVVLSRLRCCFLPSRTGAGEDHPHVLPPRPAGLLACLAARPDLDVVVVAHTGLDDLVSPAQIWRAIPLTDRPMTVRWWHEPAAALPADPADLLQWLQVQWTIVDSWIGARKARACLPSPDQEIS